MEEGARSFTELMARSMASLSMLRVSSEDFGVSSKPLGPSGDGAESPNSIFTLSDDDASAPPRLASPDRRVDEYSSSSPRNAISASVPYATPSSSLCKNPNGSGHDMVAISRIGMSGFQGYFDDVVVAQVFNFVVGVVVCGDHGIEPAAAQFPVVPSGARSEFSRLDESSFFQIQVLGESSLVGGQIQRAVRERGVSIFQRKMILDEFKGAGGAIQMSNFGGIEAILSVQELNHSFRGISDRVIVSNL